MDTLLFLLIFAAFLAVVRGLDSSRVLLLWAAGAIGVVALFEYHVTSSLDLNF